MPVRNSLAEQLLNKKETSPSPAPKSKGKSEMKYEIVSHIGIISEGKSGWNKEINVFKWGNNSNSVFDMRQIQRDENGDVIKIGKGISLSADELTVLKDILDEELKDN